MTRSIQMQKRGKLRTAACLVFILVVSAALLCLLSSCFLFSTDITIKNLDITVDIAEDGTVTFTETSEAKFSS